MNLPLFPAAPVAPALVRTVQCHPMAQFARVGCIVKHRRPAWETKKKTNRAIAAAGRPAGRRVALHWRCFSPCSLAPLVLGSDGWPAAGQSGDGKLPVSKRPPMIPRKAPRLSSSEMPACLHWTLYLLLWSVSLSAALASVSCC